MRNKKNCNPLLCCLHKFFKKNLKDYQLNVKITKIYRKFKDI